VQHDVVVEPAAVLEVREAGAAAAGPVGHVVRFAAGGLLAEPVIVHARGDQRLDRAGVQVALDHRDDHRVTRRRAGRVPSSHAPPSPGLTDAAAVGGPPGPAGGDPLLLQCGPGVHPGQLGDVDVDQGLDRLPGPARVTEDRGAHLRVAAYFSDDAARKVIVTHRSLASTSGAGIPAVP
jgi:hypothetical protein